MFDLLNLIARGGCSQNSALRRTLGRADLDSSSSRSAHLRWMFIDNIYIHKFLKPVLKESKFSVQKIVEPLSQRRCWLKFYRNIIIYTVRQKLRMSRAM